MAWGFVAPEVSLGVSGGFRERSPVVVSVQIALRPAVLGGALGARTLVADAAWAADNPVAAFDPAPDIARVQKWAGDCAAGAPIDGAKWITQARRAALLPEVSLSVDLGDSWDKSWSYASSDGVVDTPKDAAKLYAIADDVDRGVDRGWSAKATWRLDELAASPNLVRAATLARAQVERRDEAVKTVTTAYFERRRRLAALAIAPPRDPLERIKAEISVDELTATIDALTCGRFTAAPPPARPPG